MAKKNSPSLLVIGFEGTELTSQLAAHLQQIDPCGVILFRRNIQSIKQTKKLLRDIHGLLGNIIIAIDHEGGLVNRFPHEFPTLPSAYSLGRKNSREVMAQCSQLQAETLRYLGFNLNFAPVVDLFSATANAVIGTRSYSSDPKVVADLAQICIHAHQERGVGATAKHFPGHGDSQVDPHFTTGAISHTLDRLWNHELIPFQQAISQNVAAIMAAHLTFPAIDPDNAATFSSKLLDLLLRQRMGFNGLIFSDCVEMAGAGNSMKPEMIATKAIKAGIDCIVSSFSLKKSYEFQKRLKQGIDQARKNNILDEALLNQKQQKLFSFLRQYPSAVNKNLILPTLDTTLHLHLSCMEFRNWRSIPAEWQKFRLVEITQNHHSGILYGETVTPVGKILTEAANIISPTVIRSNDTDIFQKIVAEANSKKHAVLLVTSNAYTMSGFSKIPPILHQAKHPIHIALVSDKDILGINANEWITWGFNAGTGLMLKKLLLSESTLQSTIPPPFLNRKF